jgi:iduronate 2-sulfatase
MTRSIAASLMLLAPAAVRLALQASSSTPVDPLSHTYLVYYLGGQSNMEGFGINAELPADLRGVQERVRIFHGNMSPDDMPVDGRGIWAPLQPGYGTGFTSDGVTNRYADRFGPELAFGQRMAALRPDARIAIIKYARGGSTLEAGASGFGTWDPTYAGGNAVNQYDHFLATVRHAMEPADIDGDGHVDRLVPAGIVWMQGEGDAYHSEATARKYEANLRRLMTLFRAALRVDDLPVVIGRIRDSREGTKDPIMPHADIVREAQARFVAADRHAALVTSTDRYEFLPDGWHYKSAGVIDLGRQFADAMHGLGPAR